MIKYVFSECRDEAGVGSDILFDTEEGALEYAQDYWNSLNDHDKNSYKNDAAGSFYVFEIEITNEQYQLYLDEELDVSLSELWSRDVWNAL